MDAVNFVSCAIGRCVDACCLLVDLILRIFSWLLHLLSNTGCSLHSLLVTLSSSTLVEYWNLALLFFLTVTEVVSSAAHGALHTLEGCLQTLGGVFESFKMVGHLSCHVAWRAKELMHRGLISGNYILRQTCEGLCIALSLVLYFVNTVVNMLLIGMQNCFSVFAGAWEAVAGPLHKAVELALTLLTFLYSCLVGASVLLWTPCQLVLDFLGALARVFITVFVVDAHGLLITVAIISLALLYLNPRLPLVVGRLSLRFVDMLPGVRGVQAAAQRLRVLLQERALAFQESHAGRPQQADGTRLPNTDLRAAGTLVNPTDAFLPLASDLSQLDSPQLGLAYLEGESASGSSDLRDSSSLAARTSTLPLSSALVGVEDGSSPPTDSRLLSLLKEQEERKKCVICQDRAKTVLLLPCRHLCLCRHCADILTQRRPIQQRCCPLCRQPITQNMDVFL
ncbi:E3 ubiquitin-protein ligase RNF26-like isoform X3 [Myripristis murdjan]|uniref:E3 ubiquitin-protein ligase RNF26-like isoform X2 n=1 Tax=Myripristis murdjan TaxID=586833 RepID=UPI0011762956|nr:E3 ubiquitin-protein ligase RNF26-like isoform X2 [Myripristis murdjan]XP_029925236.1 E3 ubiquitin-protein ligase RNF26-like isoform X3 [Myripristis murdjan]